MTYETAKAGNWVAETFAVVDGDISLLGSAAGYVRFSDALSNGDTVFYSAFDDNNNREAGYATYSSEKLTDRVVTATLKAGIYAEGENLTPVNFTGDNPTIAGTFNQAAFEDLWEHISRTDNPHEVIASQIPQSNEPLGETVQDALDTLSRRIDGNVEDIEEEEREIQDHLNDLDNPHEVKAPQVELEPKSADLGDNVQQSLEMMLARYQELAEDLVLTHVDGNETVIQIRRGPNASNPPTPDQIDVGELSFDYDDGRVFSKLNDGTVVVVGGPQNIKDAPKDSYLYGRRDGVWTRITPTLISDEPPSNVDNGTLWFDTGTTAELYVYDGAWVSVTGGNGGFGENGEIPDNIVLDDADGLLQNVALAREIDSNGDGAWRQITTSDLVTENNQPMFRDAESDIRNQQQANLYLHDKIKALEGAVGEHSLMFTMDLPAAAARFAITDGFTTGNRLEDCTFIVLPEEDRNGSSIDLERLSQGDVLRVGDGMGEFAELRINGDPQGNTFPYNKIGGDMDRLSDAIPYDFTVFVAFDPAGLATIDYVDGQDAKRVSKSGSTMTGTLGINTPRSDSAHNSFRIHGRINGRESYLLRDYQRRDTDDKKSDYIEYFGGSSGDNCIMNKGQIAKLIEEAMSASVTTWKYVKDQTSPKDGEFSYRENSNQVVLVMGNKTSDGILWVHGHGREDSIGFEDSFFVSVSQQDGNFNLISDVEDFEFSRKNKTNTHVYLDDAEWEIDLVEGQRYCIRIPGLLPIVKF